MDRSFSVSGIIMLIIRRIILILVGVVVYAVVASWAFPAYAVENYPPGCTSDEPCTRAQAQTMANQDCSIMSSSESWQCRMVEESDNGNGTGWYAAYGNPKTEPGCHSGWSCGTVGNPSRYWKVFDECPAGEWPNPLNPSECLSPDKCLDRNMEPGIKDAPDTTRTMGSNCVAGCDFRPVGPQVQWTAGGQTFASGHWEYTGNQCAAGSPPKPRPEGEEDDGPNCAPVGNQTACLRDDGKMCYTSSTGRQICWNPGETGEKTDGPNLQERQPGEQQPDQTKALSNGDTANQTNTSTTTTNVTNNYGSTYNITTTQTTYTTTSGATPPGKPGGSNAPGNNQGGGNEGGDEDGEGDQKGSSSSSCEQPPACSKPGSIECAQLQQAWKNHCAAFGKYEGLDPTGPIEDTVTKDEGLYGDMPDAGEFLTNLPKDGWASRGTCPVGGSFHVFNRTYNLNQSDICLFLDAFAALMLVIASFHAGRILLSGNLG